MRTVLTYFFIFLFVAQGIAQVVNTQYGQVRGNQNGGVLQFLGITYAKPPIISELDSLRWKAPQHPDAWTGVRDAFTFAPPCPQKSENEIIGNEDCLYLNIWTPSLSEQLPVMVFIHGGGNENGSTSEFLYFGKNMAERGKVVVVTIQYRLGPLGFLVHPGLEREQVGNRSGNFAVLDQIMALNWLKDNVTNFGGDPNNVTIFGESAGAVNVSNLLVSPLASGLFHRAIIQSGSPVMLPYPEARNIGINYVNQYITAGNDLEKIKYMRSLPADSLVKDLTGAFENGIVQLNWTATLDGYVFEQTPFGAFQSGNFNKVPLIVGSNANEVSIVTPSSITPLVFNQLIREIVPPTFQSAVRNLYPPGTSNQQARASYINFFTDLQFTAPARRIATCVSENQTEPVWRYFLTYEHQIPGLQAFGAYHGMELFYIFNTWEDTPFGRGLLFRPQDDSMQVNMLNYWVNFAKTGNPNGTNLVNWPTYNGTEDCYLEIKATPNGTPCGVRTAQSDVLDKVSGLPTCATTVQTSEAFDHNRISIFPNPTHGIIYLALPYPIKDFEVELYNTIGQKVGNYKNVTQIDLTAQRSGIYHLVLKTPNHIIFKSSFVKI
jgi:para-nitrobenzyl esterase